jgi:ferredoxin-NADP reductase
MATPGRRSAIGATDGFAAAPGRAASPGPLADRDRQLHQGRDSAGQVVSDRAPEGGVELTIDRLEDGEVSPYFHDVVVEGDQVEVRGPFTSYFVWHGEKPVILVGGGSGVVPLMCMLRHRRRTMPDLPMRLVYSVRHADDVIYEDEMGDETLLTFTREPPEGWSGHRGHIDAELIAEAGIDGGIGFVCGSNGFVETGTQLLLDAGFDPQQIRTERFGPTG